MTDQANQAPNFPMARKSGCPFDPPPDLLRLLDDEPATLVRLWDGSTAWLVVGYENQRAVLADERVSSDAQRKGYPHTSAGYKTHRQESPNITTTDNPKHDIQRRMLAPVFTVRRMEALRPRVQNLVDTLIDRMLSNERPEADLVQALALPLPSEVICEMLGFPYDDHEFFEVRANALHDHTVTREQAQLANEELRSYVAEQLFNRKPSDDAPHELRSRLLALTADGSLTEIEAVEAVRLLIIAGHETTANQIALGVLALLEHPDQRNRFVESEDPREIANAVEELLRYLTIPHAGRRRVAVEDLTVGGQVIRAGEGIILANDAGNRDGRVFASPNKLDICRQASHHIAFGFGIHQCLGQALARMELQVAYTTLFRRLPELRLSVPIEEIQFKSEMIVYGVKELPITWKEG
jgi:cytochrome P450